MRILSMSITPCYWHESLAELRAIVRALVSGPNAWALSLCSTLDYAERRPAIVASVQQWRIKLDGPNIGPLLVPDRSWASPMVVVEARVPGQRSSPGYCIPGRVGYIPPNWHGNSGSMTWIPVVWTYGPPAPGVKGRESEFQQRLGDTSGEIELVARDQLVHPIVRDAAEEFARERAFTRRARRITTALSRIHSTWVFDPIYDRAGRLVCMEWIAWDGPNSIVLARLWRHGQFRWLAPTHIPRPASMIIA